MRMDADPEGRWRKADIDVDEMLLDVVRAGPVKWLASQIEPFIVALLTLEPEEQSDG